MLETKTCKTPIEKILDIWSIKTLITFHLLQLKMTFTLQSITMTSSVNNINQKNTIYFNSKIRLLNKKLDNISNHLSLKSKHCLDFHFSLSHNKKYKGE